MKYNFLNIFYEFYIFYIFKGLFPISVKRKQILGIIGIVMAVLGGITWFYQEKLPAIMLWGLAALILFQLNKKKNKFRK